jgi:putative ABC transport system permease protein
MLMNFFKVAWRNLVRQKSVSLINLFGLTVGITCCLLILAYTGYELSYDRYHVNAENIFRVASTAKSGDGTQDMAYALAPVGETLVADFPEVLASVRVAPTVKRVFRYDNRFFFQDNVLYCDGSIFQVFSFDLISGNPETALEAPFTMVVTESTAEKIFRDENPIGKVINWDNRFDYTVTGVVKDPPANSHFTFEAIASFATYIRYDPRIGSWTSGGQFPTYVLLRENTDIRVLEQEIAVFNERYMGEMLKQSGTKLTTWLQPLKSIHLHSRLAGELGANGDIAMIYVFAAVAFIILLIACINFMNLATARSFRRAREVGVRKVLGAERGKLVLQFLSESFLFALLSLGAAALAANILLPVFRRLVGVPVVLDYLKLPWLYGFLGAVVLFVGFVAGSYPAFYLSSFPPSGILTGSGPHGRRGKHLRTGLVVFQFGMSVVLIVGTLIIFNQSRYLHTKDLGFQKNDMLVIAIQNPEVRQGLEAFKNEALKIDGVISAGASSMVPGELYLFSIAATPEGKKDEQPVTMDNFLVDDGFLKTFQIQVVQGRDFSKERPSEMQNGVLLNETAVRMLGWDNPVGKTIELDPPLRGERLDKTVIGVFRDIHQRSLYSAIQPTVVYYVSDMGDVENRIRRLTLRLDTENLPGTLAGIESAWKRIYPNLPYNSFFLDDFYDGRHRGESRLGGIFRAFAVLAVLIGCVGLFGLALFLAERRTREIGIRKVLGSSIHEIMFLLVREFVKWVIIANLIACPVAYFLGKSWLRNFPYAVGIGPGIFFQVAFLTMSIALLTVGSQAVRAALADPVRALRHE